MLRFLSLIVLSLTLHAVEAGKDIWGLPDWILPGVLAIETRSYMNEDGVIIYVDKRVGRAGEYGPFQMTRDAFNLMKKKGEKFERLKKDMPFAEEIAARYLFWIYNNKARRDWTRAVAMYNEGFRPSDVGYGYAQRVREAGRPQTASK
jgi:hypothetical protein